MQVSRWLPRRSITTRLTLVATGAAALALLVLLGSLYAFSTRQTAQGVDDGLAARLSDLQSALSEGDLQVLSAEPYAQLSSRTEVLATSGAVGTSRPLVPRDREVRCDDDLLLDVGATSATGSVIPLRVRARCLEAGMVLAVGTPLQPQREAARQLLLGLLVAGPALLVLIAAVVRRTAHSALRPVDVLARTAEGISEGSDVRRRLAPMEGDDEIARLSHTLDAMLSRLAVSFARERTFVDDASHELRTPVAVLRGELELALSDLDDRAGVEQSLRAALAEAERLSRLTEDLLVLARQDAGSLTLRHDSLDLHGLLDATAARLTSATGLRVEVSCRPAVVVGDADRLVQVLTNLVTNAAAAGATAVRISADADQRGTWLAVEDDGPGFPPGFSAIAFERFSRADAARTRGSGAGLGLSMVAAIVTAAGGSVTLGESRIGGAGVHLELPWATGGPP